MDIKLRILGILAALVISAFIFLFSDDTRPPLPDPLSITNLGSEIIASHLDEPRSVVIAKNGIIFISEKSGKIRIIDNNLLEKPLITFSVVDVYDAGLLGIALHPDPTRGEILYAFHTYKHDEHVQNRISMITVENNHLVKVETILDGIPGSHFSNGGVIKFGPDKMLYAGTGSISDDEILAQDNRSLAGKILRINPNGSIPNDNPDPNSYVYASGMRNPQGLEWDSNGTMYATDRGPGKNDEINIIYAKGNYGWPYQQCTGNAKYVDSLTCYDPSLGIAGITIAQNETSSGILVASLQTSNLYLVDLSDPGKNPRALLGGLGRIRDVAYDSNGSLYVLTSNTDNMGFAGTNDDLLVKINYRQ